MANVIAANVSGHVIPIQVPAFEGLKYVARQIRTFGLSPPSVIYLDTAHEYPSTELEMQAAWELLPPDGILTGDDYDKFWPAVQQSVNEFVAYHPEEIQPPASATSVWGERRAGAPDGKKEPPLAFRIPN